MKGIEFKNIDKQEAAKLHVGIVVARWNSEITGNLRDGAVSALESTGVLKEHINILEVPGSFELISGATKFLTDEKIDVVICIGVLIKGETLHFKYISNAVANGIAELNIVQPVPVIYGVLNCLNESQAISRANRENNHGVNWGKTAVEMGLLHKN